MAARGDLPHLPGFRDHMRGHEVAGPGVDAGGRDSWHACILGPAPQVQHVCWHPEAELQRRCARAALKPAHASRAGNQYQQ